MQRSICTFAGLEISEEPLVEDQIRALKSLVARYGLLVVRSSGLDLQRFGRVVESLGEVVNHPFLREEGAPSSGVFILEHSVPPEEFDSTRSIVFGSGWHADLSFLKEPPALSLLWCEAAPESSGDTLFCDTAEALAAGGFSQGFVRFLASLSGEHEASWSFYSGGAYGIKSALGATPVQDDNILDLYKATHPLIYKSDVSQRLSITASPAYMDKIDGLSLNESEKILDIIYGVVLKEEFFLRVRWTPDTLVVWDNMRFLHRALNQGVSGTRRIFRANVACDR